MIRMKIHSEPAVRRRPYAQVEYLVDYLNA
ncbi:hypothetical protein PG2071B_1753 [Bifidobacterium pseudolongum subsp. globosum]|uniref:Uncharacterized protein n=1 Tax=Bifidobacterium pseudolongum subsp. globosum TaxID=1690 RepID=A0A4Q5A320_9BIFI|nr:hypothetical protein PG2071B_1753 [Bifidobacterium pseudolongum subsp. globosum]